jgi:hypothetical protein
MALLPRQSRKAAVVQVPASMIQRLHLVARDLVKELERPPYAKGRGAHALAFAIERALHDLLP